MISYSTLFHPLALDLLIIPVSIGLGLLLVWITEKMIAGLLVQFILIVLFDLWFWGSFYEDGLYADSAVDLGDFINYGFFSAATWGISWLLLYYKNYRKIKAESRWDS
ncbi:hypothetical protein AWH48_16195 [Domibacillus aminovorans]|uniref:Uncharacterized protein n=1 Tax=Domibacillus aminovorans TaxID=29332 RepID=A0A177L0T5_9BACI|nr:hypothetical protein [Domibacillus aminovorans]OAH59278.1 hypothetical protein AWH48_16195 [Domibacillus aminovorans]